MLELRIGSLLRTLLPCKPFLPQPLQHCARVRKGSFLLLVATFRPLSLLSVWEHWNFCHCTLSPVTCSCCHHQLYFFDFSLWLALYNLIQGDFTSMWLIFVNILTSTQFLQFFPTNFFVRFSCSAYFHH